MGLVTSDFRTTDHRKWRDHVFDVTGTHFMEQEAGSEDASFVHKEATLGRLSVNRVDTTSGYRVKKSRRGSHYAFQFIESGHVEIDLGRKDSLIGQPGDVFIVHPDLTTEERWSDSCSQLIVRVSEDTIEEALHDAFGSSRSVLRFKHLSRDPGIAMWLKQVLMSLVASQDQNETGTGEDTLLSNHQVSHHLSQSLLMMLLTGLDQANQAVSDSDLRLAPYYVKRVERYLQQNFAEDISMDNVISVAGVSARTVFFGFRRWLGTTPMGYLRDYRLSHARKELRKGRTGTGVVSSAAMASGFSNFGQFSKLYRARFGETPSATLLRARD